MAEQKSIFSNFATPYKFTGKELDDETGMYYFGARYYSARESIWMSVDPLMEKYPNFSPYNYCMSNPLNLIDPDGMSPEDIDPPGKKKTPMQRAYNPKTHNTDIGKLVLYTVADFLERNNSYKNKPSKSSHEKVNHCFTTSEGKGGPHTDNRNSRPDQTDVSGLIGASPSSSKPDGNKIEKTRNLVELIMSPLEFFKAGQNIATGATTVVEIINNKSENKSDTIFSVTRKIDSKNNSIHFVNGSKKADSIISKNSNSVKKIEKIY